MCGKTQQLVEATGGVHGFLDDLEEFCSTLLSNVASVRWFLKLSEGPTKVRSGLEFDSFLSSHSVVDRLGLESLSCCLRQFQPSFICWAALITGCRIFIFNHASMTADIQYEVLFGLICPLLFQKWWFAQMQIYQAFCLSPATLPDWFSLFLTGLSWTLTFNMLTESEM